MAAQPVTELLVRWRQGDSEALQALVPLVYNELHDLAHRFLQRGRSDREPIDTQNHAHFGAIAARLMRQMLVDYSRCHRAAKCGANCSVVLEEALVLPQSRSADVIVFDDALTGLARIDEQQSRIVERFLGGLISEETAQLRGISAATVKRDWRLANAWLSSQMKRV